MKILEIIKRVGLMVLFLTLTSVFLGNVVLAAAPLSLPRQLLRPHLVALPLEEETNGFNRVSQVMASTNQVLSVGQSSVIMENPVTFFVRELQAFVNHDEAESIDDYNAAEHRLGRICSRGILPTPLVRISLRPSYYEEKK